MQGQMQLEQAKLAFEQEKTAAQMQFEQAKMQTQTALQVQKQETDLEMRREAGERDYGLKRELGIASVRARGLKPEKLQGDEAMPDDDLVKSFDEDVAAIKGGMEQLGSYMIQMGEMLAEMQAKMDAPKRVVRDRNGQVVGVEAGGRVMSLVRDEQGRPAALQ
jgi:hypothetical protein